MFTQIKFSYLRESCDLLFGDFGLDLWLRTIWSCTINNLEEYFKLDMLQDHI